MLKSMTGFGRCENVTDEYKISVEMKAVTFSHLPKPVMLFNITNASLSLLSIVS